MITKLNQSTQPLPIAEPVADDPDEKDPEDEDLSIKTPFKIYRRSPIKSQYNNNKKYLTAVGSKELTENNITFLTKYRNNVSRLDTFEIFYQDVFVSDIEKKQYKQFKFELLPSIESTVNHPGGSNVLRGATTIPDVKPGIPIRTVMKHRNINIMGGKNVIQTIGIDSKFIILVGAFIGDNEISSYQEAKFFDEQIVQPGLRVSVTIKAHFGSNLALPNPKKEGELKNLKGFISEFKLYAVRREKSYYSITIIIEDFPTLPDPIEDFRLEQQRLKEIELKKSPTPPSNSATSTSTSQSNQSNPAALLGNVTIPDSDKPLYQLLTASYFTSTEKFNQIYNSAKLPSNATEQSILDRINSLENLITLLTNTDKNAKNLFVTGIIKEKDLDIELSKLSIEFAEPLKLYYDIYYKNKRQLTEVYKDLGYLYYIIFRNTPVYDFQRVSKRQSYQNKSKNSFYKAELNGQTLKDQNLEKNSLEDLPFELKTVGEIRELLTPLSRFLKYGLF